MRDEHYTPFEGTRGAPPVPMRVLFRFHKPGRVAEIRERRVTQFRALEFLVFIDEHLQESHMFHGARLREYPKELEQLCASLRSDGWVEDLTSRAAPTA